MTAVLTSPPPPPPPPPPRPRALLSRQVVLCRASESWTSASQFRSLSTEQIDAKVVELKGELLDLRIQRAARKEVATHQFKHKRRAMAQLLTVRREKEIEQGIGTRESRKLEKKKALDAEMADRAARGVIIQRPKSTKLRAKAKAKFAVTGADN